VSRFETWALLLGLAASGCSSSPATVRLEVYSWWDERPESLAFELVANLHESLYPNVEVVNLTDPLAMDARTHVAQIALAGAPPATFQANIGADLLRWTAVDPESGDARGKNRIYGLSRMFGRTHLIENLPDAVLEHLRAGDSLEPYAVPINIHRLNVLYYNEAALAKWAPPAGHQSWLELSLLCPSDPSTAARLPFKIAIGAGQPFTLTLLVFENLLPAIAGAEFYDQVFTGELPTASGVDHEWKSVVRQVLGCAQFLGPSLMLTSGWETAVHAVLTGTAAATVIGDWAGGQLASEPHDSPIASMPFPGSDGIYVFTSDAFPLPVDAEHKAEAAALLETIASSRAQKIFSEEKGSIPARKDVALNPVDALRRKDFEDSTKALATSGRFPPYYNTDDDLNAKLRDVVTTELGSTEGNEAIEAVVEELVALQPLLLRWRDRVRIGPLDTPMP
jgi:glucose/mannose transport system substrate-binding protein